MGILRKMERKRTALRLNQWNSFIKASCSLLEQAKMMMLYCLGNYIALMHCFLYIKSSEAGPSGRAG